MIDRHYFEQVLLEQVQLMERPVRMTVHLQTGSEYVVHSLFAGHDGYVILKVYPAKGKPPEHSKPWQTKNPNEDAAIYDQVCIPYALIASTLLTGRSTKGDEAQLLIGFRPSQDR